MAVLRCYLMFMTVHFCRFSDSAGYVNKCNCDNMREVLTKEIFDLKVENNMLTSRIEQIETVMNGKSPVQGLTSRSDINRLEALENRMTAFEAKSDDHVAYSKNALDLKRSVTSAMHSEKVQRKKSEMKIEKGLKRINESLNDINVRVDARFDTHVNNSFSQIDQFKSNLSEDISRVEHKVQTTYVAVASLVNQTKELIESKIDTLEADIEFVRSDVSKMDADIDSVIDIVLFDEKAICEPDCTNGGVCFKANECRCKPFTEGTLCEKFICEQDCYKNGEQCVAPGKCQRICPELPNIQHGRTFQDTSDGIRNNYGSISEYTCDSGYLLNGNKQRNTRECQADGTWSGEQPVCHIKPTTPYAATTTEDSNKDSTVTDESHQIKDQVEGCMLSSDKTYTYMNDRGVTIPQGSVISSGTTLTVTCTTTDYDAFYSGYDNYSYDTPDPTVTCTGNELSNIDLYCPEVQLSTCMELHNGKVTQSIRSTYYVSCDEGFSLDLIFPKQNECICKDGVLKSVVGNKKPACIPDNCVLPFEIDDRMSVFNKNLVSLSGGSTVDNGDHVYFNCSKADEQKYEPLKRRFRCLNGQWLEAERDPNWKFGNNGTFPKCREAKCEPVCENGGVCYKDNSCKCKHLTTGDQCEKVLCDDQCIENGGTCIASGNCSCPVIRFGNNCERKGCILPEHSAKPKSPKIMYQAGQELRQSDFESKHGYSLSSPAGMTCQDDGTWSDIVHYIKVAVYLIRVKTVGDRLAGVQTDARVYIYLHGLNGKTDIIYLTGSFESGDIDETRKEAKDIRPITSVEIGHDGGGFRPDWNLEYASIFVENMNEYYVFRQNEPVWVYERDNVVLPVQGNCISDFDEGHTWYPKWDKLRISDTSYIGKGSTMSRRECQQRCTELTDLVCKSVYYHRDTNVCWGVAVSHVSYFTVKKGSWNAHVHIRFCK